MLYTVEMMKAEAEDKAAELDAAFQQSLFIHDRPFWQQVYGKAAEEDEIEADIEWVTPDSPDEFRSMMDDLKAMGVLSD